MKRALVNPLIRCFKLINPVSKHVLCSILSEGTSEATVLRRKPGTVTQRHLYNVFCLFQSQSFVTYFSFILGLTVFHYREQFFRLTEFLPLSQLKITLQKFLLFLTRYVKTLHPLVVKFGLIVNRTIMQVPEIFV